MCSGANGGGDGARRDPVGPQARAAPFPGERGRDRPRLGDGRQATAGKSMVVSLMRLNTLVNTITAIAKAMSTSCASV